MSTNHALFEALAKEDFQSIKNQMYEDLEKYYEKKCLLKQLHHNKRYRLQSMI